MARFTASSFRLVRFANLALAPYRLRQRHPSQLTVMLRSNVFLQCSLDLVGTWKIPAPRTTSHRARNPIPMTERQRFHYRHAATSKCGYRKNALKHGRGSKLTSRNTRCCLDCPKRRSDPRRLVSCRPGKGHATSLPDRCSENLPARVSPARVFCQGKQKGQA